MGPVRQNPIQRTVSLFVCVCIALCTIVAQNIAQNRPDSFPPYPPDNHHCSDDVYLREGGWNPERCRKPFTKIFLSDHDIPLTGSNFGNLTAFRANSATFSLRMRSNGHL